MESLRGRVDSGLARVQSPEKGGWGRGEPIADPSPSGERARSGVAHVHPSPNRGEPMPGAMQNSVAPAPLLPCAIISGSIVNPISRARVTRASESQDSQSSQSHSGRTCILVASERPPLQRRRERRWIKKGGPWARRDEGTKRAQALAPDSAPRTVPSGGRKRSGSGAGGGLSRGAEEVADHVQAESPPVYEMLYFTSIVMTVPRGGGNGSAEGALDHS